MTRHQPQQIREENFSPSVRRIRVIGLTIYNCFSCFGINLYQRGKTKIITLLQKLHAIKGSTVYQALQPPQNNENGIGKWNSLLQIFMNFGLYIYTIYYIYKLKLTGTKLSKIYTRHLQYIMQNCSSVWGISVSIGEN